MVPGPRGLTSVSPPWWSFCCGPNRPSYLLCPCPRTKRPGRASAVLPPKLLGSAICRKTRAPHQPGQLVAFQHVTKPLGICFLSLQPSVGINEPSGPLGAVRNGLQTRTGLCDRRGVKRPRHCPCIPGPQVTSCSHYLLLFMECKAQEDRSFPLFTMYSGCSISTRLERHFCVSARICQKGERYGDGGRGGQQGPRVGKGTGGHVPRRRGPGPGFCRKEPAWPRERGCEHVGPPEIFLFNIPLTAVCRRDGHRSERGGQSKATEEGTEGAGPRDRREWRTGHTWTTTFSSAPWSTAAQRDFLLRVHFPSVPPVW